MLINIQFEFQFLLLIRKSRQIHQVNRLVYLSLGQANGVYFYENL